MRQQPSKEGHDMMIISNPAYLAAVDQAIDVREAAFDAANETYAADWQSNRSAAIKARVAAYKVADKTFAAACAAAAEAV
jgi:hypothetical protein